MINLEKVILIGVNLQDDIDFIEAIEEMKNLAKACDKEVIEVITQNLKSINNKTYINSGKIEEILNRMEELDIHTLLVDKELSPSQHRSLIQIMNCEIIDKTNLILQIFEKRAKTKEAKLQVESAKLKYILPRLAGSYVGMDKQRGGGVKNRGSGEKKLESDVRSITQQLHSTERQLKEIATYRTTQRKKRVKNAMKNVALIGYTNAGKSSILNGMTEKQNTTDKTVFEEDMLFATLTTTTRKVESENHSFLLSDTVGFVSDLPHSLIKAFHSTLEEVREADLLLHVVDFSNSDYLKHIEVTNQTLQEIEANNIPVIYVYNKCDKTSHTYPFEIEDHIYISAKEEKSITLLIEKIINTLYDEIETNMLLPYEYGNIFSFLNENSHILKQEYKEDGIYLHLKLEKKYYDKYKEFIIHDHI